MRLLLGILVVLFASLAFAGPINDSCVNISVAGVYTLTQDISAASTCIEVQTPGVRIDCQTYEIQFDTSGVGSTHRGIRDSSQDDLLVENCVIRDMTTASSSNYAIDIGGLTNFSLINSTVYSNTSNGGGAVQSSSVNNATFIDVVLVANASGNSPTALSGSGTGLYVLRSNISVLGRTAANAIGYSGGNVTITNSTFHARGPGSSNYPITLTTGERSLVHNNNFTAFSGRGFSCSNCDDVIISNNRITAWGTGALGIRFDGVSSGQSNNIAVNNIINVSSNSGTGFSIGGGLHGVLQNNSIKLNGTSSIGASIQYGTGNWTLENNTFAGTTSTIFLVAANATRLKGDLSNISRIQFSSTLGLFPGLIVDQGAAGSINWDAGLSGVATSFNSNIALGNLTAFVNVSAMSVLNSSAQVIIGQVPYSSAKVTVDTSDNQIFDDCVSCTIENFASSQLTFNVSSFSTYKVVPNGTIEGSGADLLATGVTSPKIIAAGVIDNNNTLTGVQNVVIADGSDAQVSFSHNFTGSGLDPKNMTITKAADSIVVDMGGQLLAGETKTLTLVGSFTTICVKDAPISSAAQISGGCTGDGETSFDTATECEGTPKSGVTCIQNGSRFHLGNLTHSGAQGSGGPPPAPEFSTIALYAVLIVAISGIFYQRRGQNL
jgi:hypothetical protein